MLFLLSPAKSLDYETPAEVATTEPRFLDEAEALIGRLRELAPAQVASLMALSDRLAALNVGRYAAWQRQATPETSKAAALAFDGDVYDGLQARTLGAADLAWAQDHLVILSGLYGVLRPLDALQPYRLEMGTRLANPRGRDLYAWWGDRLAAYLDERLAGSRDPVVVNLASQEYARAAVRPALRARVVTCVFEDWKDAGWRVISFHAKRARGMMARHAVLHRIDRPEGLREAAFQGYRLDPAVSTDDRLVFRRRPEAA